MDATHDAPIVLSGRMVTINTDPREGYCVDCYLGSHDKCDGGLWASARTDCTCHEAPHKGRAIAAHRGHDLVEDSPLDDEAEDVLWCNTCDVTVWYLESNMAPDA